MAAEEAVEEIIVTPIILEIMVETEPETTIPEATTTMIEITDRRGDEAIAETVRDGTMMLIKPSGEAVLIAGANFQFWSTRQFPLIGEIGLLNNGETVSETMQKPSLISPVGIRSPTGRTVLPEPRIIPTPGVGIIITPRSRLLSPSLQEKIPRGRNAQLLFVKITRMTPWSQRPMTPLSSEESKVSIRAMAAVTAQLLLTIMLMLLLKVGANSRSTMNQI